MIPHKRLPTIVWGVVLSMLLYSAPALAQDGASGEVQGGKVFLPLVVGGQQIEEKSARIVDLDHVMDGEVINLEGFAVSADMDDTSQCIFPSGIMLQTSAPDNNVMKWVAVLLKDDCNVVVASKWTGGLNDSPLDVIRKIDTKNWQNEYSSHMSLQENVVGSASINASFESNEQYIITFGYPGAYDELTRHTERLTYT